MNVAAIIYLTQVVGLFTTERTALLEEIQWILEGMSRA